MGACERVGAWNVGASGWLEQDGTGLEGYNMEEGWVCLEGGLPWGRAYARKKQ